MKRCLLLLALPLLGVGCSTSQPPLRQSTATLEETDAVADASPAGGVTTGAIAPGFTPEQVKEALGEPEAIRAKASGRMLMATWSYPNYGAPGHTLHVTFEHGVVSSMRTEAPSPAAATP